MHWARLFAAEYTSRMPINAAELVAHLLNCAMMQSDALVPYVAVGGVQRST